jgi:hypothetical protein
MVYEAIAPVTDEVLHFHKESLVFLAYTVTPIRLIRPGASLAHMAQSLDVFGHFE